MTGVPITQLQGFLQQSSKPRLDTKKANEVQELLVNDRPTSRQMMSLSSKHSNLGRSHTSIKLGLSITITKGRLSLANPG